MHRLNVLNATLKKLINKVILDIEQRVQQVTSVKNIALRVSVSVSEDTQVLHYQKKGRYLAQHNDDFFDPKDYAGQATPILWR